MALDWNNAPPEWSSTYTEEQVISSERQEPTFYARVPKMAIMDLSPYELALYCNYKQTASESGVCFKSNATLAKETQMSAAKVKTARRALAEKGFIIIEYNEAKGEHIHTPPNVKIIDVWEENHKRYAPDTRLSDSHPQLRGSHPPATRKPQRRTNKEEPSKKKDIAPNGAAAKKPTSSITPQSYMEQHPEMTEAELEAQAKAVIAAELEKEQARIRANNEAEEYLSLVAEQWDIQKSRAKKIMKFLRGKFTPSGKKKQDATDAAWIEHNPDRGLTLEELKRFTAELRRLADNNPRRMPILPEPLGTAIHRFHSTASQTQVSALAGLRIVSAQDKAS